MGSIALDQEFVDLAAEEVRGHLSGEQQAMLYNDENIDRFYSALISLKRDVEIQLVNHRSRAIKKQHEFNSMGDDGTLWMEYRAEEIDWRARAIKFLSVVEDRIAQVKLKRYERHQRAVEELQELREGVQQHREEIEEEDASEADRKLWELAAG